MLNHWSAGQLNDVLDCPKYFYDKRVKEVRQPPFGYVVGRGSAVDRILTAAVMGQVVDIKEDGPQIVTDYLREVESDEAHGWVERVIYEGDKTREFIEEALSLADFYWNKHKDKKWISAQLEADGDLAGVPFRGIIDGIYLDKSGNTVIVDWKVRERNERRFSDAVQLSCYYWWWYNRFKTRPLIAIHAIIPPTKKNPNIRAEVNTFLPLPYNFIQEVVQIWESYSMPPIHTGVGMKNINSWRCKDNFCGSFHECSFGNARYLARGR